MSFLSVSCSVGNVYTISTRGICTLISRSPQRYLLIRTNRYILYTSPDCTFAISTYRVFEKSEQL